LGHRPRYFKIKQAALRRLPAPDWTHVKFFIKFLSTPGRQPSASPTPPQPSWAPNPAREESREDVPHNDVHAGARLRPLPDPRRGLKYHGAAPTVSLLRRKGIVQPIAYPQEEVFEAARIFAMTEGLIPAPETAHAVKAAMEEALEAKREGKEEVILFNYSGHGLLDLQGYA